MECACTLAALRGHRARKVYDWGGVGGWGTRENMYYVARRVFLVKILNLGHVNLEFNPKILNFSKLQI